MQCRNTKIQENYTLQQENNMMRLLNAAIKIMLLMESIFKNYLWKVASDSSRTIRKMNATAQLTRHENLLIEINKSEP
jgi:predicted lactoylglutathione lyase